MNEKREYTGFVPLCPITPSHPDMLIGSAETVKDDVTADKENEFAGNTYTHD